MSKIVSTLFKIARIADTVEMASKGKAIKRARNKFIGKKTKKIFKW